MIQTNITLAIEQSGLTSITIRKLFTSLESARVVFDTYKQLHYKDNAVIIIDDVDHTKKVESTSPTPKIERDAYE